MKTTSLKIFNSILQTMKSDRNDFIIIRKRDRKKIILNGILMCDYSPKDIDVDPDEKMDMIRVIGAVKREVNKSLLSSNFKVVKIAPKCSSVFNNQDEMDKMKDGEVYYYIDINHCYWRIAYLMGYISEGVYYKVLKDGTDKVHRNMALACISAPVCADYYYDGKYSHTITEDNSLNQTIYDNIRHRAWNVMYDCTAHIGRNNVLGFITDGIMVKEKAFEKAKAFLRNRKFTFTVERKVKRSKKTLQSA